MHRFGSDASDLKFQEVLEGNLVHLVQEVQVQLNYKFLTRPIAFEGFQRTEKDQYPIQALREMLLNALVHRTYMGAAIQMRVFDNKLSIWNEGGLPHGLSLEDLKLEHNSRPRNPIIANACFFAGYIDTWGRGTLKIINSCKEAGLPEPIIKEMNGGVEVTIFSHPHLEPSERLRNDFGNEIATTFEIILNHPEYTSQQIAKEINKTPRTVETYLAKLKNAGIIIRRGPKLGGHWEIKSSE